MTPIPQISCLMPRIAVPFVPQITGLDVGLDRGSFIRIELPLRTRRYYPR